MLKGVSTNTSRAETVLLDGGATHNVFYNSDIPEGSVEPDVELAHGTKKGYVKDRDTTFVDPALADKPENRLF